MSTTFSPEVQAIIDRVMSGEDKPRPRKQPEGAYVPHQSRTRMTKASRRGANLRGGERSPRHDYAKLARLWTEGMAIGAIAEQEGCSITTVRTALKKIRPEGYTGKSGPRPKKKCINGHDLSEHGRRKKTGGGRECTLCRKLRGRGEL